MKRTWWLTGLALFLAIGPPGRGQENGLAIVPAEAPVVAYCHGVERVKDRLVALIKNISPDHASMAESQIDAGLKKAMTDRELKGVAKNGPIFVVLTELPEGEKKPPMAAIIRINNFNEFRDGILKEDERKSVTKEGGFESAQCEGQDVYFVNAGDYAIVATNKKTAAYFTKKHAGLDAKLTADQAKKMLASDVALYIDMAAINKQFGDQIQGMRQMLPVLMSGAGDKLDKHTAETIQAFADGTFQFLADSEAFLVALDFRPEGLALHTGVKVGADSSTNNYLKESKSSALDDLGKFPGGQMFYWALQLNPQLAKTYLKLIGSDTEATADLLAADPKTLLMDMSMPPRGLQVWNYADPAKAVSGNLKLIEALGAGGNFQNAPIKGKPEIKRDAETYRGFKMNSVHVLWDFEKLAKQGQAAGEAMVPAMKKMMGEGLNAWFGTDGKAYIQVSAADWDAAKKLLDEYLDGKDPISGNSEYAAARSQLPAETTGLAVIDGPQYIEMLTQFMGPVLKQAGLPMEIPNLKAEKGKSYFGVAVTLRPEHGAFDLWLPASLFKEIHKMAAAGMQGGEGM